MARRQLVPGIRQDGFATSVAVMLFFICFLVSILYQILVLRRDVSGGVSGSGRSASSLGDAQLLVFFLIAERRIVGGLAGAVKG